MSGESRRNFGLFIAYFIPGFIALWSVSPHSPPLARWLGSSIDAPPTLGGFLFVAVTSTLAGLTLSTLRWLVIDQIHHRTGLPAPNWNFVRLQANIDAFEAAIDHHYRYYQFYANTLLALPVVVLGRWPFAEVVPGHAILAAGAIGSIAVLFFVASRDALRKYYARASVLIDVPLNP